MLRKLLYMIGYSQILNLRTLVLKFSIFGNDVEYQEFNAERSEYLNLVLHVIFLRQIVV